jgi:hypothetical protein
MKQQREIRRQRGRTVPVSWAAIMKTDAFKAGVEDARAGRGYPADYETGGPKANYDPALVTNWQWNYERGRYWVAIMGRLLSPYTKHGTPCRQAIRAIEHHERLHGESIL